ncbi:peptidoglycan-binding protein [Lysinibacillus sp. PLM2]|nr:peptidoglycan-binding protein [Lysinibacillus sp. PLM2]
MYNVFLDGVQFPVAPSSMKTRIRNKNKTVTLINEGEVNILKQPGLTEVDTKLLLPNVRYPFAVYPNGFQPAVYYLNKLEQLKLSEQPFPFIVNRMMPNGKLLFDTNLLVSLEDYDIEEDADDGFDIVVTISLKLFRPYGNKRVEIKKTIAVASATSTTTNQVTVKKERDTSRKQTPKTHTVVPDDTMWAICKRYFGTATKAIIDDLAKKNNIANPNLIYPGQVIKIE